MIKNLSMTLKRIILIFKYFKIDTLLSLMNLIRQGELIGKIETYKEIDNFFCKNAIEMIEKNKCSKAIFDRYTLANIALKKAIHDYCQYHIAKSERNIDILRR